MKVPNLNQLAWARVWPFLIAYPALFLYLGWIFTLIWFSQLRYPPAVGVSFWSEIFIPTLSIGVLVFLLMRWSHRGHITGPPQGRIFRKKYVTARTKLHSIDPAIRREGIEDAVRMGPSCLPMLVDSFGMGYVAYRDAALEAVDRIHPGGVLPALIEALEEEQSDGYASWQISEVILGLRGDRVATIPALIAVLRRGQNYEKVDAALSAIGLPAFSPLMEVLEDREAGDRARGEAISSLRNCLQRQPEGETHRAALRRLDETLARIASDDGENERLRTLAESELAEARLNVEQSLESLAEIYSEVFSRHGHTNVDPRTQASSAFAYGERPFLTPIQDAHLCSETAYEFALSNGRNALVEMIGAPPEVLIESQLWALVLNIHKWLYGYRFGAPNDLLVDLYLRNKLEPQGIIEMAVPMLDVHSLHLRIKEMFPGSGESELEDRAGALFPSKIKSLSRSLENFTKKNNDILDFFRSSGFVHWEAFRTFAIDTPDWLGSFGLNKDIWLRIHHMEGYREEFPFIVLGKAVSEVDKDSVGDVIVDVFLHQCDDEGGFVRLMQSDRIAGWHASVEASAQYRSIYDHPEVAPHYRSVRIRVPRSSGITVLRSGDSLLLTYRGPDDFIEIPIVDAS